MRVTCTTKDGGGLGAWPPRKILKIRCSEIESEGNMLSIIISEFFFGGGGGGGGKLECLGRKLPPPPPPPLVDRTLDVDRPVYVRLGKPQLKNFKLHDSLIVQRD